MAQLALYQPDIAQNLGAMLRLAACLDMVLHVIEPCGFPLDDKRMRRAGMDYIDFADWRRHNSWEAFEQWRNAENKRLVLMTTKTDYAYTDYSFTANDVVLFGRESAGAPNFVHHAADVELTIPMNNKARSLNLALSAAITAGEICRQLSLS